MQPSTRRPVHRHHHERKIPPRQTWRPLRDVPPTPLPTSSSAPSRPRRARRASRCRSPRPHRARPRRRPNPRMTCVPPLPSAGAIMEAPLWPRLQPPPPLPKPLPRRLCLPRPPPRRHPLLLRRLRSRRVRPRLRRVPVCPDRSLAHRDALVHVRQARRLPRCPPCLWQSSPPRHTTRRSPCSNRNRTTAQPNRPTPRRIPPTLRRRRRLLPRRLMWQMRLVLFCP